MPTIAEVRQQYPQYNDMSDADLAGALHRKYYSDIPVEEFNQKIGLSAPPKTDAYTGPNLGPLQRQTSDQRQADDHGLARREQMSPLEKAVSPFTEYPRNYEEIRTEAGNQFGRGLGQLAEGFGSGLQGQPGSLAGLGTFAKGVANTGLGALGFIASPVSAAYRSVIGQPLEDVTGIPREQTEFAAQLLTPGIGLTGRVPVPGELPVVPRGFRSGPEPPPPGGSDVAQAARRLDVDVPRAVSSDSRVVQEVGQKGSKLPVVGQPIAQAVEDVAPQLAQSRGAVAEEFGSGTAPNAASRIERHLTKTAEDESQAAQAAADAEHQAATNEWQQAQQQREATIAAQEQQSTQAAQQSVGPDVAPPDMGEAVIGHVRAAEQAAQARKNALYEDAASQQGMIHDNAVGNAGPQVAAAIRDDVTIRPRLTPAAYDMQRSLRAFSERARQRLAQAQEEAVAEGRAPTDADPTGLNLRDIESQRKELGRMANSATSDEDARAARHIMGAFDDWQQRSMAGRHFDGSPEALTSYLNARAANHDWRQRFGYNGRDDADKLINKIVRGADDQHTGPLAVSDALTAGNDKSGPLVSRVLEATGDHPDVLQAIRSGTWNKLSRDAEGVTPRAPERIASDIYKHLYSRGRDVAERVFTQEQRDLMRAHADTLREAVNQRSAAADIAKASRPVPTKIEPGPIQQLADTVIGGGRSDEALFKAIEGYAKSKNLGGDVKTLAEVMRRIPSEMKGDFVHSFINRLGVSKKTNEFSPDVFASEWENITPQAKAVLFGNAGAHVQALNDIATVSRRIEQVRSKFGNPSGTAGAVNFYRGLSGVLGGIAAGHPVAALATVASALPPYMAARVLASPSGASSVARFARATERLNNAPNTQNAAAARLALRNVVNTARSLDTSQQRSSK
jgi:hypothetical protein